MTKRFTEIFPKDLTYDKKSRVKKAKKIFAVLKDSLGKTSDKRCLDLGCSLGHITYYLGKHFKQVIGVDVDTLAIDKAKKLNRLRNVSFNLSGENSIPFLKNSFDALVFNQIYEHVQNPKKLVSEIKRVLKPGGVCYFGARNKFFVFDGHYRFPFLSIFPKVLANFIVRTFWHKKEYDINLYSLKNLRNLVRDFEVSDYTLEVIRYPEKYFADYRLLTDFNLSKIIYFFSKFFYFFIPNYIWVLRKKT